MRGVDRLAWRSHSLALGFGLSIPLFFATSYAWVLWIVAPLFLRTVHRLRGRKHPSPGPSPGPGRLAPRRAEGRSPDAPGPPDGPAT